MDLLQSVLLLIVVSVVSLSIGVYIGRNNGKKSNNSEMISEEVTESQDLSKAKVEAGRESVIKQMDDLKKKIAADFIGLAIYDIMNDEIRWRLAVGATNSRYKRIVIRLGKGIAGEVVQLNRVIKIEKFPHDVLGDPIEYPILLVEHLKSVVAAPVSDDMRIYGVLLVGQRTPRSYSQEEEKEIKKITVKIAEDLAVANMYEKVVNDNFKDDEIDKKEYIYDSAFVKYLMHVQQQIPLQNRGALDFEVLDQSIVEIPESVQQLLIGNVEEILSKVLKDVEDRISISIVRDEGNLLIETKINKEVSSTRDLFANVYEKIGEIGGSIISYHEENHLLFVMQLPVWSYRNPLI